MTWVPLQDTDLSYSMTLESGVTFVDSVVTVSAASPTSPPGKHFNLTITTSDRESNLALGWDGTIRMTVLTFNVESPGVGEPFESIYLVKSEEGALFSWVQSAANSEPPYPAGVWGADDITAFVPNQLETFDNVADGTPYSADYFLSCSTGTSISYTVLIEAFVEDVGPDCFWTDLENVEQEC